MIYMVLTGGFFCAYCFYLFILFLYSKKTRLQFRDSKQEVTGLIVNKKLNVDRRYYKITKAMADSLYRRGEFNIAAELGTAKQLEGRFAFINQIDRYNNKLDKSAKHNFRELNGREKQYQKFLFYKYFYANEKPLIVTEGKTDIVYLKAALKNLYSEYPNLSTKQSDGKFKFKISFLRRSNRLSYFFGISQDGADGMKNLYNFFVGKDKNYPNYLNNFTELCPFSPRNPVVLFFDNELDNKNKPIKNFVCHTRMSQEKIKTFQEQLNIKLIDYGNLFLMMNPLINEESECEIELLFKTETIEQEINGKTFSRKDGYDTNLHYGKEIFSQYISKNYKTIDFSEFRIIFDKLNVIIDTYVKSITKV